jgi:hypothetical protein
LDGRFWLKPPLWKPGLKDWNVPKISPFSIGSGLGLKTRSKT